MRKFLVYVVLSILTLSCQFPKASNNGAIDSSDKYKKALEKQNIINNVIYADVETDAEISDDITDDCADDPAIWLNTNEASKSVIFGSNKKRGIHSYTLDGKQKQFVAYARINNIDVRQGIVLNGKKADILAGSNRTSNSVDLFLIDTAGKIHAKPDYIIKLEDNFKPYGFCLYKNKSGQLYAFVNNKKGEIIQISVDIQNNKLDAKVVKKFKLNSQVEGMVADDSLARLYVAEEDFGIHMFDLSKNSNKSIVLNGSTKDNIKISFDIEGVALLKPNYLVASIQGNFTYAVFDIKHNRYVTSFKIEGKEVDRVEETDGIEIFNESLGNTFPEGVLIVQDGFNYDGKSLNYQNFKIIDLRKVKKYLK